MPPRPTWKGYIKVSLVNIPVKVYPATEASATISFNQLHAACQTKIQQKKWCPKCEIELTHVDNAYYLAPEGPMAADAYAVMRDGMQGKAGIGKVAIHGREYLVAVKRHKQGMVMYTLHHAAEIRTIDQIEELREVRGKVNPAEMKLAKQVIESFEGELNLADYKDEYQEGLRQIIEAKVAGEEIVEPAEVEAPAKGGDLMEALRKS